MKKTLIALAGIFITSYPSTNTINLNFKQAQEIGKKIWHNECNGTIEGLTSWNPGEEFASLGIAHFIWYPKGKSGHFNETFPALVKFLKTKNTKLPTWLEKNDGCPWASRKEFSMAKRSRRMHELREFLLNSTHLQSQFIVEQLAQAL